ncbi:hypothetical protein AS156_11115 [Bradyrhizobium macuxiense]|uniref:Uncharacterized protein n=1 Tax=Bradyrhizobium macuxiense TaxID=1755647 RepID=A0A109JNK8_9BRAD|nr:hypothetical protein AS156_11115 [Bradyrhizobium macuxiense]
MQVRDGRRAYAGTSGKDVRALIGVFASRAPRRAGKIEIKIEIELGGCRVQANQNVDTAALPRSSNL